MVEYCRKPTRGATMKKLLKNAMILLSLGAICSCGNTGGKTETAQAKYYEIHAENTAYYRISAYDSVKSGDETRLSVTKKYDCFTVSAVKYNGNTCSYDESTKEYYFTMPSEDVEITVDVIWIDTTEDSFMSWDTDNVSTITDKTETLFHYSVNLSMTTWAEFTYFSTNEGVLPTEAIEHDYTYRNTSNIINGGYLTIDDTKLTNGETKIAIFFESKNEVGSRAAIVVPVTVNIA